MAKYLVRVMVNDHDEVKFTDGTYECRMLADSRDADIAELVREVVSEKATVEYVIEVREATEEEIEDFRRIDEMELPFC